MNPEPTLLPRLLYLADVPVESSYHGSALIYRLLQNYPAGQLKIMEAGMVESQPERRLAGVPYSFHCLPFKRLQFTRFTRAYASTVALCAARRAGRLKQVVRDFKPEAILTVAHGYSWITAAALARQLEVPLHLICHDEWADSFPVARLMGGWKQRMFRELYCQAVSRFCVSPFMAEEYQRRYGVPATVLYPSQARDAHRFAGQPPRLSESHPLKVVFAGTVNSEGYVSALRLLACALEPLGGQLLIYGPLQQAQAVASGLNLKNIELRGLVSSEDLVRRCREDADILFAPMSFNEADASNMRLSFPSKISDYTLMGVPLLIYGPEYCSAVRWAKSHPGAAEVVTSASSDRLATALQSLADPARRSVMGNQSLKLGEQCFSHETAQRVFFDRLWEWRSK